MYLFRAAHTLPMLVEVLFIHFTDLAQSRMDDKIEIEDPNERHTGQVIIE
jgi:hypothetical protein